MSTTHATRGGGIRSQARLQIGENVVRTDMWVAGNQCGHGRATERRFRADSADLQSRLAANDAERYVIEQARADFRSPLEEMAAGEAATLEFHGNHGPCQPCRAAIDALARALAGMMWNDTTLCVSVYYSVPTHPSDRGSDYGYPEGETQHVTYGRREYQLESKALDTRHGQRIRPRGPGAP